ncbi:YaiO family outer membrane beta-barrel protein [Massilia sp. BJB1822]|uniref:YaiO family outer membrane beta-barrel protein n=1 Tax=Massilia sp. BJB1822 TaxID=2744470 RepID=UPI001592C25C|nr:YaiO family outer membrane beta-barrel protein [Massilia sp. BJB1822]NVD97342.1 YaiO family outer membrane beta-barrel protein [Massilia sp. BJB1822]
MRRAALARLACVLLAFAAHLSAQADETPRSTIGLASGKEHLSNGSPDWRETSLQLNYGLAPRQSVGLGLTRTRRFGLNDTQVNAGLVTPLGAALVLSLEANASSSHHVLAKNALGGALQYEFSRGWLLHGGGRSTRYNDVRVNQGLLMLEHYFSDFSASLAWRPARAFGTTAHGLELRASYYYSDRDSVGIIVAGGKEAANTGGGVQLSSLRSAALVGRHWLGQDWALNYSLGHTRQGDFYIRNGFSLGLQAAF